MRIAVETRDSFKALCAEMHAQGISFSSPSDPQPELSTSCGVAQLELNRSVPGESTADTPKGTDPGFTVEGDEVLIPLVH